MTSPSPDDEQLLAEMQTRWPNWRLWRSRRADIPHDWMATRLNPNAGPTPTLMEPTPHDLEKALKDQAARAAAGEKQAAV